jgi:hypothetical protein
MIPFHYSVIASKNLAKAEWRKRLATQYPADKRNLSAAALLEKLACVPFSEVDPARWGKLRDFTDDPTFVEAVNIAGRHVGFSLASDSINDFISHLTTICAAQRIGGVL